MVKILLRRGLSAKKTREPSGNEQLLRGMIQTAWRQTLAKPRTSGAKHALLSPKILTSNFHSPCFINRPACFGPYSFVLTCWVPKCNKICFYILSLLQTILVIRNPKDVAVSHYYFHKKMRNIGVFTDFAWEDFFEVFCSPDICKNM